MRGATHRQLPGLLLIAAFALSQVGFCLAVPSFRGIDEFDHAFRASSVAHGHWWAGSREPEDGRGFLILVEESIATAAFDACDDLTYTGADNCSAVTGPNASGEVEIASAAATYNPAWYSITGVGSRVFSGDSALYAMRIIAMLIVDLLLFGALALARGSHHPLWLSGGVMVAATPIVAYSSTVAAPNGATYAAGILLWVSLLRLSEDPAPGPRTWVGIGLGACTVMVTHSTGVMLVPVALVCAAPVLWHRRGPLWRQSRRPLVVVVASVAVVGVACAAWIVAAGTNDPRNGEATWGSMPLRTALVGPLLWFLQSIATLTFRNLPAPIAVYVLGAAVIIPLVVVGFLRAGRTQRTSMVFIAAFSIAIPVTLTWLAYGTQGAAWQGRYGLPLAVGLILLSAQAVGSAREADRFAPVLSALLVALVAAHAITIGAVIVSLDGPLSSGQTAIIIATAVVAGLLAVRATTLLASEVFSDA